MCVSPSGFWHERKLLTQKSERERERGDTLIIGPRFGNPNTIYRQTDRQKVYALSSETDLAKRRTKK